MSLFFRRPRGLSAIAGPVLRPADPGYADELATVNTAQALRPGLVVGATGEDDVVAAVGVAAADRLPVAVKGTGHGLVADPTAPVLISTRRLDAVEVDPVGRTARVGAGATWRAVLAAAAPHGLVPLAASSTAVGVAGYTLGGGLGVFGRRHGFAADHVRRLRLVTADGRPHEIDPDRAPELHWALRGGGARGFGVVTELEFGLFPMVRFVGGGVLWPGAAAADVLHTWARWAVDLPDDTSTSIALLRPPYARALPDVGSHRALVHVRLAHVGPAAEAHALLAPLRAVAAPLADDVRERAPTDLDAVHRHRTDPTPLDECGAALRALPADAVDALLAAAGPDVAVPLDLVELRLMGGALARPPDAPSVVGGREAACALYVRGPARTGAPQRLVDALAPWSLGGAVPTLAGPDPGRLWAVGDRVRVRVLRRAVDPGGMFAGAEMR